MKRNDQSVDVAEQNSLSINVATKREHRGRKAVAAAVVAGLAIYGAADILNLKKPNILDRKTEPSVEATPPVIEKIIQTGNVCGALVLASNDVHGIVEVTASANLLVAKPSVTTEVQENWVHVKGDYEVCADGQDVELTATTYSDDPSRNTLHVQVDRIFANRPRPTNLADAGAVRGGLKGPARLQALSRIEPSVFPRQLMQIGVRNLAETLCEEEVLPVASEGLRSIYQNVGQAFDIPQANVTVDISAPKYERTDMHETAADSVDQMIARLSDQGVRIDIAGQRCVASPADMTPSITDQFMKEQL